MKVASEALLYTYAIWLSVEEMTRILQNLNNESFYTPSATLGIIWVSLK